MLNFRTIGLALSVLGVAITQLSIWAKDKADNEEMQQTIHDEVERQLAERNERE